LDGDFQSNYLAAEQAYGAGDFEAARNITLELLSQLEPVPEDGAERDAVLAWRAFVALLAGHIELYGFQDAAQAESFYKLVLASNPQDTLQELAEQGLERTLNDHEAVTGTDQVTDPVEAPRAETVATNLSTALIADPFLGRASDATDAVQPTVTSTAMPWLKSDPSPTVPEQPLSSENDGVAEPQTEPEPLQVSEPEPETASANIETDGEPSDTVPEQPLSSQSDDDAVAEPKPEPEPLPVSEPEPETASANIETDDEPSDTAPEQPLSSHNDDESDREDELLQGSTTRAVNIKTDLDSNPEISDAIRKRLENGRLRVVLPDRAALPSENSSESSQVPDRWSRLRKALGRS
tara:strand:+ start:481 stop:1536 length:1056 start_codon:yes stop_codon:yes gene_type:complete